MRATFVVAAGILLAAAPARAQLSPRVLAVDGGVSSTGSGARPAWSIAAGLWIDGPVEGYARLGGGSAPRSGSRTADVVSVAAGLRAWLGDSLLRPYVGVEAGVVRTLGGWGEGGVGAAALAGLEAFVARDVAFTGRLAARWASGGPVWLEAAAGVALYF
jgi:hypothetical protein